MIIRQYIEGLKSGIVNGYSYIDHLSYSHIETLCQIASIVSKTNITGRNELKNFTLNADKKIFKRYVKRVIYTYKIQNVA